MTLSANAPAANRPAVTTPPVRGIIADDSSVIRGFISRALENDPTFKIVATASDGQQAIDALTQTPADVVILDIEMPIMDGLAAIPKLKAVDPAVQIIMASALTQKNADISLRSLALGATDYIPKPSTQEMGNPLDFQRALREKVKTLGLLAWSKGIRQPPKDAAPQAPAKKPPTLIPISAFFKPDIIAIGSSTGGPQALFATIKSLGANLPQPVVITQHMPAAFTATLADHISKQCNVPCSEAKNGDTLQPGHYYVAPGDFHMLLIGKPGAAAVRLVKDPPENFCRPAVDPMLRSLVAIYGGRILTLILTGMGQDGWKGSEAVVKAGGVIIAQDEASSVVWGMPGAVATAGICSAIVPLSEIGARARQLATKGPQASQSEGRL